MADTVDMAATDHMATDLHMDTVMADTDHHMDMDMDTVDMDLHMDMAMVDSVASSIEVGFTSSIKSSSRLST